MLSNDNSADEILDAILKDQSPEEQLKRLRNAFVSTVNHGWVDEELQDSIYSNLCNEYNIPYEEVGSCYDDLYDDPSLP